MIRRRVPHTENKYEEGEAAKATCDTSRGRQDLAGREQVEGAVFGHVVPEAGCLASDPRVLLDMCLNCLCLSSSSVKGEQ